MSVESTYPQPPYYYKEFKDPNYHLSPPPPMEGLFWSNGEYKSIHAPIPDYVPRGYKSEYNKEMLDETSEKKDELTRDILKKMLRSIMQLIDDLMTKSNGILNQDVQRVAYYGVNMVRLLNDMREYQLRENIIRGLRLQIKEKQEKIQTLNDQMKEVGEGVESTISSLESKRNEFHPPNEPDDIAIIDQWIKELQELVNKIKQ